MKFSPNKINGFLLLKLPSAFFSGVRVKSLNNQEAVTTVKHRWVNQNPFKSMYFAVQCMASELSTGLLIIKKVKESNENISMLVIEQKGSFTKKARGRIHFTCSEGYKIDKAIEQTLKTGEGQIFDLTSRGIDEKGDEVSFFTYQWSIKKK